MLALVTRSRREGMWWGSYSHWLWPRSRQQTGHLTTQEGRLTMTEIWTPSQVAALAALKSARFPTVNKETGTIDYKHKTTTPLPLVKQPLPLQCIK